MSALWVVINQNSLDSGAFFGREGADPSTITFVGDLGAIKLIQEWQSLVAGFDLAIVCQNSPASGLVRAGRGTINGFKSKETMNFSIKFSGK